MYSLPHCVQCKSLKRKLESANIEFEEIIDEALLLNLSKETGILTAPIVEDKDIYFDYYQTLQKYGI